MEPSPLFGRSEFLAALRPRLAAGSITTLTGPAGVGKTSIAEQLVSESPSGVFCDLSDARTLDDALSLLAAALGARLVDVRLPDEAAERLSTALTSAQPSPLVLDNCESAPDAAAALATLAARAQATVLVTTREPLGANDEHVVEVPELDHAAALDLLLQRGQLVCPAFAIDDANRRCAERALERLDRLPLAIELFASRLDALSLPELEARLSNPLEVLRDASGRTARFSDVAAAIQVSWDLLDDEERLVLQLLAVCKGGASLALVEAIRAELREPASALDALQSLIRKHLAYSVRQPGASARTYLLETVRAFADAQAERADLLKVLRDAHARVLLRPGQLHFAPSAAGHRALADEVENLLAAHQHGRQHDALTAASAARALHPHYAFHGPMHAHLDLLDAGIAAFDAIDVDERPAELGVALRLQRGDARRKVGRLHAAELDLDAAAALSSTHGEASLVESSRAMLAMVRGELDEAAERIGRAVHIAEEAGFDVAAGLALQRAGGIHLFRGDYPLVEEVCVRALAALERDDHLRGRTNALTYLGIARLDREESDAAREAFDEAREAYLGVDDAWSVSVCDVYLALIVIDEGDVQRGRALIEQATLAAREVGHARLETFAEGVSGIAAHLDGDLPSAVDHCRRGVGLGMAVKDLLGTAVSSAHLAAALAASGQSISEARHWLSVATQHGALLPNPSAHAGLAAIEGVVLLAEGDVQGAHHLAARASSEPGVHARLACRILERVLAVHAAPVIPDVLLEDGGRRVVLADGAVVDLARRGPMRRIVGGLARSHVDDGAALNVHQLVEVGWPGESISTEAGTARVYSAVRTLRRLGLEGLLETRDDGYGIRRDATVVFEDPEPEGG